MYLRNMILTMLAAAGVVCAQNPIAADPPFQVRYAANLNVGESYVYITNGGANGASLWGPGMGSVGNICVNVYTLTPDEQLLSCCSCLVTPNGLVSLAVKRDLTSNGLMPAGVNSAVIKLVSTLAGPNGAGTNCANSAAQISQNQRVPGMVAWGTTIHALPSNAYTVTETPFTPVSLSSQEVSKLSGECANIIGNGSGYGICGPCHKESGCSMSAVCPNLDSLVVGQPVNIPIPITGGVGPYSCSMTGSLPPGLHLTGCAITGTPTATAPYNFTVTVADSSSPSCTAQISCHKDAPPPNELDPKCENFCAAPGRAITPVPTFVSGGTPPYAFSQFGLPSGLAISPNTGVISGTVAPGATSSDYYVRIRDSSSPQKVVDTGLCRVTISPAPTATCPQLISRRGPPRIGIPINPTTLAVTGTAPYTLSVAGLPPGISMSPDGTFSGALSIPVEVCEANPVFDYKITIVDSSTCPTPVEINCTVRVVCDP